MGRRIQPKGLPRQRVVCEARTRRGQVINGFGPRFFLPLVCPESALSELEVSDLKNVLVLRSSDLPVYGEALVGGAEAGNGFHFAPTLNGLSIS